MLEKQIETANQWIDAHLSELTKMSDTIFDHPEIGPHEYKSSALLTQYLEDHGFAVTRGIGSLETAFRAIWKNGEGGPNIGLLCEFDALPLYLDRIWHAGRGKYQWQIYHDQGRMHL